MAARRRARGDDAPAGPRVDAGELPAERRGRPVDRVAPARERLPLGAARQSDLDLEHGLAVAGLGARHLVDAQIAGPVDAERSHTALW